MTASPAWRPPCSAPCCHPRCRWCPGWRPRPIFGPGDTLLLYTDGLTEARVDRTERYEEEALLEFLTAQAPASAPDAVVSVRRLLDGFGEGLDDDTAVLAVSVAVGAAVGAGVGAAVGVPASGPGPVRPG